ncbi:MAG: DUF5689 domain-containing protein [Flavobacteriaceae bacterium]
MKNIFKIVALFLFLGTFTACVQDDDYSVPTVVEVEPNITENGYEYTFAQLMAMYNANYNNLVDLDTQIPPAVDENNPTAEPTYSYLVGYVVSNDRTGNFYKSIYIQDAPENPTIGFKIDVDMYDTYFNYEVGRKVYVKLNGLGFDDYRGVFSLGALNGTSLVRIPELQVPNHVLRSTEVATIVPTQTTTTAISNGNVPVGILVQLQNMQVPFSDLGISYANLGDTYSVDRTLESCDNDDTVILRNSGYADFRTVVMPWEGAGTLTAVNSKYNSDAQLLIRGVEDLDFTINERCDPLFADGFNTLNAWTVYDVLGPQTWFADSYNGSTYAKMSGYAGGNNANEDWLISPAIDLSSATAPVLTFRTAKNYTGPALEVFMSTNYSGSGDPYATGVTWTALSANLSSGGWNWTDSGNIDLSSANGGDVYIAFKFTSTASASATWEVDNVLVDEM